MSAIQEQYEKAVAEEFFDWFNQRYATNYTFVRRAGEAPDLVYGSSGTELLVEITAAHYDSKHGAFLWKHARGEANAPEIWEGMNPDCTLVENIVEGLKKKCAKRYGQNALLLLNVPPGLTSAEELFDLLSKETLPSEFPFVGVFVCGRFPMTSTSSGGYRVLPLKKLK